MTPQEQQLIDGLISRIRNTQVQNKDSEAEQHIQQGLGKNPDALYVLTQTVLVQQYGLEQAQSQIGELKQQIQTLQDQSRQASQSGRSSSGSFLSHIFGDDSNTQAQQPPRYQPVSNPGYGAPNYPPPTPPPPAYPATQYAQGGPFSGGSGGFLQGALQTAAGVAAGEMVFQGMEDLFHGFGGHRGGYGFGGGAGGETIVNNYYDDDRGGDQDRDNNRDRDNDSGFYNPEGDASRQNFAGDAQTDSDSYSADLGSDSGTDNDLDLGDDSNFDDNSSGDFSSSDDNS